MLKDVLLKKKKMFIFRSRAQRPWLHCDSFACGLARMYLCCYRA